MHKNDEWKVKTKSSFIELQWNIITVKQHQLKNFKEERGTNIINETITQQ